MTFFEKELHRLFDDSECISADAVFAGKTMIAPIGEDLRAKVQFVYTNTHAKYDALRLTMRGMTGLELARQLKDIQGDINIIFVTGFSEYSLDAFRLYASDYLLKPATPDAVRQALGHLRTPVRPAQTKKIRFQCFGNFEAYVENKPLVFKRAKTKELLAYLVDRMGASATMGELMAVIWEDGPDTSSRQSNLRNLIADLKNVLSDAGVGNIILKNRNSIAIDCESVDCDYYDFLRHIPYAVNSYHGEYMMQYSWAEITTAALPRLG